MKENKTNLMLALLFSICQILNVQSQKKPNIILVYADDISARELPIYGSNVWTDRLGKDTKDLKQRAFTPVLDKMAKQGCYVETVWNATVCSPSRAMMMTGRYAHLHKWWDNPSKGTYIDPADGKRRTIPLYVSSPRTIGHIAKQGGYSTYWAGKTQMGEADITKFGFDGGLFTAGLEDEVGTEDPFTDFILYNEGGVTKTKDGDRKINDNSQSSFIQKSWYWQPSASIMTKDANGKFNHAWWPNTTKAKNEYSLNTYGPDVELDFIFDFMGKKVKKDQPFFIYHTSHLGHAQFDFLANGSDQKWPQTPKVSWDGTKYTRSQPNIVRRANGSYNLNNSVTPTGIYNHVNYLDYQMSLYIKKLEELGIADNTLIIFTADNGTKGYGKSSFDRQKGTHVPFIVYGPGLGMTKKGKQDVLVNMSDILPTIAEIGGVKIPDNYEINGESLWPFLTTNKAAHRKWIYGYQGNKQIIRDQKVMIDGKNEIYDVRVNPNDLISFKSVSARKDPATVVLADAKLEASRKNLVSIMKEFDTFDTDLNGLPNPSVNGGGTTNTGGNEIKVVFNSTAATTVRKDGSLPNFAAFKISNIPNNSPATLSVRLYPKGADLTNGGQVAQLSQVISLNSTVQDVNNATYKTVTTVSGNTISRKIVIKKLSLLSGKNIVVGNNYDLAVRFIKGGVDGTNTFKFASDGLKPVTGAGNKAHASIKLKSLASIKNLNTSIVNNISKEVSFDTTGSIVTVSSGVVTESYRIVNYLGLVVKEAKTGTIDVSDLPVGIYILVTDSGTTKFIKR